MTFGYFSEWQLAALAALGETDEPEENPSLTCGTVDPVSLAVCTLPGSSHTIHADKSDTSVHLMWLENEVRREGNVASSGDGSTHSMFEGL